MRFRRALRSDTFSVIRLYHKSRMFQDDDPLLSDYKKLEEAIDSSESLWILTEIEGTVRSMISAMFDQEQGLCKITRMVIDSDVSDPDEVLLESLRYLLTHVREHHYFVDVVYTTTLSISMDQQHITLKAGFKIFGVFPNVLGEDNSQLNGLTAFFFDNVLDTKRHSKFLMHPKINPFYQIAANQHKMAELEIADQAEIDSKLNEYKNKIELDLPELEIIKAKQFVRKSFTNHLKRRSQLVNFYPFYYPNCMITDPDQQCEVFVRTVPSRRFAAIIGEHLGTPLNPVKLYNKIFSILRENNISYVEVINDAADVYGVDCILRAGFTPCAYFPGFKKQGDSRRDYVVFGRSFEYLCSPNLKTEKAYIDFYKEYFRIEGKNYFPDL